MADVRFVALYDDEIEYLLQSLDHWAAPPDEQDEQVLAFEEAIIGRLRRARA